MSGKKTGLTLIELLVVVATISLLLALMLPAVQDAREAARRTACRNNLRQIGLSLQTFYNGHSVFPASGWTQAGPGNPAGKHVGWRPLILPYLEEATTQQRYDFERNWWEEPNLVAAAVPIPLFECPSTPSRSTTTAAAKPPRPALTFTAPIAPTDYEALMGVKPASLNAHLSSPHYNATNRFSVMSRNSRTRMADIVDGTSKTIIVVECGGRPTVYRNRHPHATLSNDQGIGWADSEGPFSLDGASSDGSLEGCGSACASAMNTKNDNEPYSLHRSGASFLFADGHVQFIHEGVSLTLLAAMSTMSAGEIGDPRVD